MQPDVSSAPDTSAPDIAPLATSAPPARRTRTWPAALALVFLSPGIAEVLSGSTPPLRFIQPFALIVLPTLYGISILLIREIIVRRGLNLGNALLMGAAFGIFQEALVVQTWYNFQSPRSPSYSTGGYGVAFGTSWDWALNLTVYHAVVSITIPLILIGLLFPRQGRLPWLGRKRIVALTLWLLVLCGALAYASAFSLFARDGYSGPPLIPYLLAVMLTVLAFVLGAVARFPQPRPVCSPRRTPRLWTVRLMAFGWMALYFVGISAILPGAHVPAIVGALAGAALCAFSVWQVRAWSVRPGWSECHWLALVTGVVLYFALIWGPLIEFAAHLPEHQGMVVTALLAVAALLFFDQRLKRRLRGSGSAGSGAGTPASAT